MCMNTVTQYVPNGFSYKAVEMRCGSTSIRGSTLLCEECQHKLEERYPQGWRETPGDTCPHGTYVGDAGGPDYLCWKCEAGEE